MVRQFRQALGLALIADIAQAKDVILAGLTTHMTTNAVTAESLATMLLVHTIRITITTDKVR